MKATTSERGTPKADARRPAGKASLNAKESVIDLVPALLNIKSILVPIDFSDTSKKALRYAERLAAQFGAAITLVHVIEPIATPGFAFHPLMLENAEAKSAARNRLDQIAVEMKLPPKMLERSLVRFGSAFAEITEAARTLKADLIILSTHGHTGLKHVVLGSTAERVVRHASCPVLVVREKEHEFV